MNPPARRFAMSITKHPMEAFASGALITLSTICTYTLLIYTPVYAVRALHLPQSAGFTATMVGTVTAGVLIPVFGHFVDSLGPRWFLRAAPVLLFVLAWPMFALVNASPSLDDIADLSACVRRGDRDVSGADPQRNRRHVS